MEKKFMFKLIFAGLLSSLALSGCITKNYVDDSGQQCKKQIKFFILFIKSSYTCEPQNQAAPPLRP